MKRFHSSFADASSVIHYQQQHQSCGLDNQQQLQLQTPRAGVSGHLSMVHAELLKRRKVAGMETLQPAVQPEQPAGKRNWNDMTSWTRQPVAGSTGQGAEAERKEKEEDEDSDMDMTTFKLKRYKPVAGVEQAATMAANNSATTMTMGDDELVEEEEEEVPQNRFWPQEACFCCFEPVYQPCWPCRRKGVKY